MNRQDINREADNWLSRDPMNRANIVLLSERTPQGECHGSTSFGGNMQLIVDSLANTILKSPDFTEAVRQAVELYNAAKIQMN